MQWSGYDHLPMFFGPLLSADDKCFPWSIVQSQVLFCAQCNQSLSVPITGALKPLDHRCPLCQYQVRTVPFAVFS